MRAAQIGFIHIPLHDGPNYYYFRVSGAAGGALSMTKLPCARSNCGITQYFAILFSPRRRSAATDRLRRSRERGRGGASYITLLTFLPAQKMCTDHLLLITQVCANCSIQSVPCHYTTTSTMKVFFSAFRKHRNTHAGGISPRRRLLLRFLARDRVSFFSFASLPPRFALFANETSKWRIAFS